MYRTHDTTALAIRGPSGSRSNELIAPPLCCARIVTAHDSTVSANNGTFSLTNSPKRSGALWPTTEGAHRVLPSGQ